MALIPALYVGLNVISNEATKVGRTVCFLYAGIFAGAAVYLLYCRFQWSYQNGPIFIRSYFNQREFLTYYYIVLQFSPSLALSLLYLFGVKHDGVPKVHVGDRLG